MKLEVIIQRSKKSAAGMINQTRQTAYVKEWELFVTKVYLSLMFSETSIIQD